MEPDHGSEDNEVLSEIQVVVDQRITNFLRSFQQKEEIWTRRFGAESRPSILDQLPDFRTMESARSSLMKLRDLFLIEDSYTNLSYAIHNFEMTNEDLNLIWRIRDVREVMER